MLVDPDYLHCSCVLSRCSCVWLLATPCTVAHKAPLPMGLSRQEYWRGLPFRIFLTQGLNSRWCSVSKLGPSLQSHGPQHTRLPCPLLSPGACSNSYSLSQWWHPTISPSVMPFLLLPSIFPSIRALPNELALCIRWPKSWRFSFSIGPSNEYSGLISFRTDWFDLLAVQVGLGKVIWTKLADVMEFQQNGTISQHPFLQTTFFPGPSSLLVISHFPVTLFVVPVVFFVGSSTISPSLFNTSSYFKWPHTPLQTATQYGSLLRSPNSSRKPLPTQSHQPQTIMMVWWLMMLDVFFFLKPHIQSVATTNGLFPTQSHCSIAFFTELNHWSFGFPGISVGKESVCNAGDLGSIPGLGRSPGEGKGYPLQYSGLGNSVDIVHGVSKSRMRRSDIHFHWSVKPKLKCFFLFTYWLKNRSF